jgi:beclin 1
LSRYKIQALGSNSLISELPPSRQTYELYASPDLSAFLHNRRFSTGLICLLDCIRQLVEFGQKSTRGWPVGNLEIRKDRISGYSIRLPGLGMSMGLSMMGLGGSGSSGDDGGGREAKVRGAELSPDEHWTKACIAVLKVLKQILIAESEAERGSVAAAAPTVEASRAA